MRAGNNQFRPERRIIGATYVPKVRLPVNHRSNENAAVSRQGDSCRIRNRRSGRAPATKDCPAVFRPDSFGSNSSIGELDMTRMLPLAIALCLAATAAVADDPEKDDEKKGTVTGVVTARGDNWIEVKADGEEKARRYMAHWRGGAPKDGGGPDKETVAKIKEIPLKARVRLEWSFQERPRVEKIEVLKKEKD